tara:strand:+ start:763 stop:1452 length:690 start_codon:yes stop_codon:yes gene_type:complete
MRQGSHSKRNRGRGGNRRSGTPGRNHTFDSNGPDIRIRGNAHQVHEKYMNLAREASTNGEAVLAESYFQHAEHYYRILSAFTDEANTEQNKNRATQPGSNENNNHDQQETPTTQSESKNGMEKLPNNNGAEVTEETATVLEPEKKEPHDDLLRLGDSELKEEPIQQKEPALALRSDERLNINLEGEGDQSTKGSGSRLRLENTENAEGDSNLRRRRGPRNNRQGNSVEN